MSPKLLEELREYHFSMMDKHFFAYSSDAAFWKRNHGLVTELPHSILLRDTEEAFGDELRDDRLEKFKVLLARIGYHTGRAIQKGDVYYFERWVVILKALHEKRPLSHLTREELLFPKKIGRPDKPYVLSCTFPLAVIAVTQRRMREFNKPDAFTDAPITREELRMAVQEEQRKAGLTGPPPISDFTLSRWITRSKLSRFMCAESNCAKPARNRRL